MQARSRHNSTKESFMIFFTVTLRPLIKYHSSPCFSSRNITKNAETYPTLTCYVIIEQPLMGGALSLAKLRGHRPCAKENIMF